MVEKNETKSILYFEHSKTQVLDSSKEVKVLGKISRVCIHGNDLVFDRKEPRRSSSSINKRYIIVPIEDRNSTVHFIKAPIYKLSKKPRAKNAGTIDCWKLTPPGETVEMDKWSTERRELEPMEQDAVPVKAIQAPPKTKEAKPKKPPKTERTLPSRSEIEQRDSNMLDERSATAKSSRYLAHLVTVPDNNSKVKKSRKSKTEAEL